MHPFWQFEEMDLEFIYFQVVNEKKLPEWVGAYVRNPSDDIPNEATAITRDDFWIFVKTSN